MKWVLIIAFTSSNHSIPVETEELCEAARVKYAESEVHNFNDPKYTYEHTVCLQVAG